MPNPDAAVVADGPLSRAGITTMLSTQDVHVVAGDEQPRSAVVVVAAESVPGHDIVRRVRADSFESARNGRERYVVIADGFERESVLAAVEAGVVGVLDRRTVTGERLAGVVRAVANGGAYFPRTLQGALLGELRRLHREVLEPRELTFSGIQARERDVLRLVADGFSTGEIAAKLSYSERTVKNIIADIKRRFRLNSRAHAVAFAVRSGAI